MDHIKAGPVRRGLYLAQLNDTPASKPSIVLTTRTHDNLRRRYTAPRVYFVWSNPVNAQHVVLTLPTYFRLCLADPSIASYTPATVIYIVFLPSRAATLMLAFTGDVIADGLLLAIPPGAVGSGTNAETTDDGICVVPSTGNVLDSEGVSALVGEYVIKLAVSVESEVTAPERVNVGSTIPARSQASVTAGRQH